MATIQGTFEPRYESVVQTFSDSLERGDDLGASVAVLQHGVPVVNVWGGFRDEARTTPWTADTLVNVWSSTKTMTFLAILKLVDEGLVDLDAPVATYWPEFAANGKGEIVVRHLMNHSAGLSGWQEKFAPEELADWDLTCQRLAAQAPWWEDRAQSGYHALTQGFLLGEVVRRVTGVSFGTYLAATFAGPLGADFHVGTAAAHDGRISPVVAPSLEGLSGVNKDSLAYRTLTSPPLDPQMANHEWWRRAEIPAANGHGNALSIATIQQIIANKGEANGTRFLSEKTVDQVFQVRQSSMDLVLQNFELNIGAGYGLASKTLPLGPRSCFWGGFGGSLIIMDQDTGLTVAYMMNLMKVGLVGDTRGAAIAMAAVFAALS